jgi:hypothetical protein
MLIAETESNHGKARILPRRPIVLHTLREHKAECIRSALVGAGLAYCLLLILALGNRKREGGGRREIERCR